MERSDCTICGLHEAMEDSHFCFGCKHDHNGLGVDTCPHCKEPTRKFSMIGGVFEMVVDIIYDVKTMDVSWQCPKCEMWVHKDD